MNDTELHALALQRVKNFKTSEAKLLEVLQIVEHRRLWEKMEYTSLLEYAEEALGLSYDNASNFSRVARKALEVPELYEAIAGDKLSLSTARRIVAVITPAKAQEWIDKAVSLKQRELQREIARENPRAARPDSLKHLTHDVLEIKGALCEEAAAVLERVQEVESQRTGKPCSFSDAILAMGKLYLDKKDPVKKAERNIGKPVKKRVALRRKPPAQTQHALQLRDEGQCVFVRSDGKRCSMRKWLATHHEHEWAEGGNHDLPNLGLYCFYHHKYLHTREPPSRPLPGA